MVRSATKEIEGVGGADYLRLYLPTRLSKDSTFPYQAGDGIRAQLVTTTCDREVLVVTSDALEVDQDQSDLELQRSSQEVQTSIKEVDPA